MTTKDMKTLSFDGGVTTYQLIDDTALHSEDISSTYDDTSTDPVNGIAVGDALSTLTIPNTTDNVTSGSTDALTSGGAYTNLVRRLSTTIATGDANQGVYVDANGQIQACNATTSTYSSTGTVAVNGTAVASALQGLVPVSRAINGKTLNTDINLTYSDVGALSSATTINNLTNADQQAAINSGVTSSIVSQVSTNTGNISTIQGLIPSEASTTNQLADKDFVNDSITTASANFIGTFPSVSALEAYSGTVTKNDYAFVETADSLGNNFYDRYKYTGNAWLFEYEINNGTFTNEQWDAINSGVTASDVALAKSALQPNTAITGATKCKITYDSNGLVTAGDDLSSTDITTALGYTPYDSSNPDGYVDSTAIAGLVPNTRTVNNKALSSDITLSASDVGALPDSTTIPTVTDVYDASSSDGMSGIAVASALSSSSFLTPSDVDNSLSSVSENPVQNKVINTALGNKQDTISDLNDIRSGASAGATALQSSDVTSTYSATGTDPINGTGVADALSTIIIPTVDQTYSASSTNAQSGTAVTEALGTLSIPTITDTYSASSHDGMSGVAVASALSDIEEVIPSEASSSNQLADKAYVTSVLPTVGNGTITFTQGGVNKGTITTNQSGDTTIALDAGGSGGSSTWGSITGTLSDQTDLQNALTSIIVFRNWEAQS